MGITIHFEGRLKDDASLKAVLAVTAKFCSERSWPFAEINKSKVLLKRVRDEKDWDYEGPVRGIVAQPHANSDPFALEFDDDLYVQEYTKTQFAPIEIHVALVELLHNLEPYFEKLQVVDEGEFFETRDLSKLEGHINQCFEMMDEYLKQKDKYYGPVRTQSKRIVDVVSRG